MPRFTASSASSTAKTAKEIRHKKSQKSQKIRVWLGGQCGAIKINHQVSMILGLPTADENVVADLWPGSSDPGVARQRDHVAQVSC
jgi:hypothetical protein